MSLTGGKQRRPIWRMVAVVSQTISARTRSVRLQLAVKNWLFSDSVEGANASAVVYTMVEMAKAHALNIYEYLKFLLDHRPTKEMTDAQLAELCTHGVKNSNLSKSHVNYSELLQLAKGWGNFISDRIIIWRLLSFCHLYPMYRFLLSCHNKRPSYDILILS